MNEVELVSGQTLLDFIESRPVDVSQAENVVVVSVAIELVKHDLKCSSQEAFAAICRDWLDLRQIPILSENRLANSTPVDFAPARDKPSFVDRIKKLL